MPSKHSSRVTAIQVTTLYAKRMQIEEAFRDLKSHRYGLGLEDSLSRLAPRLSVLLLLNALANFAAWLLACVLERNPHPDDPLTSRWKHRTRYPPIRRAMEWLRRSRIPPIDWKAVASEGA
jgi:hypothetical protein